MKDQEAEASNVIEQWQTSYADIQGKNDELEQALETTTASLNEARQKLEENEASLDEQRSKYL